MDPAGAEYAAASDRLHHIDSEFRNRDGYAIEAQVGTVLNGLGFRKEDWSRRTEEFSGGWQMRLALAKLLLEKPNLLLLDEPTNHLDLEARNWLESYLAGLSERLHPDFARPLLPGRHGEPHRRDLEQESQFLQRQLREVSEPESRAQGAARSRLPQPARAHRATGSLHQPLPLLRPPRPSRSRAGSKN